ncbi:MAG: nuclear transport factor 2 family protein [Chloroflexi bacterium]|nr:nuclear transport factor 2 family protein [Chloroflexota bacterium]
MSADDRLAIIEAIQRYSHAVDSRDAEAYTALFSIRGVFQVTSVAHPEPFMYAEGHDGILEWVRGTMDSWGDVQTRHNQSGTVFDELSADTARTRTMLLESRKWPDRPLPGLWTQGVYTDDWVREPDGWRITRRALHLDIPPRPGR